MKRVLVTRSKEENDRLQTILAKKDFEVVVVDMLRHRPDLEALKSIGKFDYIIITSKFAAIIFSDYCNFACNILCVGMESSNILNKNKNIQVSSVFGNVDELISKMNELKDNSDVVSGFVYLSGQYITKEIPNADRLIIYKTEYLNDISEKVIDGIRNNGINFIMIYSRNCSQNLLRVVKQHKLLPYLKSSVLIAISKNVAEPFYQLGIKVLYGTISSEEEMINLLVNYDG